MKLTKIINYGGEARYTNDIKVILRQDFAVKKVQCKLSTFHRKHVPAIYGKQDNELTNYSTLQYVKKARKRILKCNAKNEQKVCIDKAISSKEEKGNPI